MKIIERTQYNLHIIKVLGFILHCRFSDVIDDKERATNSRRSRCTTSIKSSNTMFAVDLTQRASGVPIRLRRHVPLHTRLCRIYRVRHPCRHGTRKTRSRNPRGLFVLTKKWVHAFDVLRGDWTNAQVSRRVNRFSHRARRETAEESCHAVLLRNSR